MKKISIGLTVSLMALTAALTFTLTLSYARDTFNRKVSEVDRLSEKYQRLEELDATVKAEYYQDVSEDDVLDGILSGYVEGLGDRYSAYRSARELSSYEDTTAGVYVGIGVSLRRNDDGFCEIVSVNENGSAADEGIVAGDLLLEIENIPLSEHYEEAVAKIEGEADTKVLVKIQRAKTDTVEKLYLTRRQIDEITVESELLRNRIGYIKIKKFRTVTAAQFEEARQNLMTLGARAVIFDVRDNGGGVLSALETLADPLLPGGELAFAHDKAGNATPIIESDERFEEMPYAVLVNGNTASASELFACLLRDYSGAVLVGEKTFGKGIMQTTFPLSSGGVTLTTATYDTGVTPCYHGIGLEPDILAENDPASEEDTQLAAAENAMIEALKALRDNAA